jgi:large subunit ribosomal protein L17
MLRNQATALIRHEHLTTTVMRAKELRPFVERLITVAKRGVATGAALGAGAAGSGPIRTLNARRLVMRDLVDQQVVTKLFEELAPRFAARPGGYTRLLRLGFRRGDATEIAQVELVGSEFNPRAKVESPASGEEGKPKAKGVGGRLRAAAERLRGKKETEEGHPADDKAAKHTAGRGAPKARPRKQGAKGS